MTRAAFLQRIQSLSEEEYEQLAPYLEADLEAANDLRDLRAEIARGLESAAAEPLLDHDDVMAAGRARLRAS
jgi:hypothetical protein